MSTPKAGRLVRVGLYDLTPGYLGKGNFAMVRLGVHKLTKTSVAVKIVEKADLDEENLQKISREIEIMRRLNHPSIIRLYQVSSKSKLQSKEKPFKWFYSMYMYYFIVNKETFVNHINCSLANPISWIKWHSVDSSQFWKNPFKNRLCNNSRELLFYFPKVAQKKKVRAARGISKIGLLYHRSWKQTG